MEYIKYNKQITRSVGKNRKNEDQYLGINRNKVKRYRCTTNLLNTWKFGVSKSCKAKQGVFILALNSHVKYIKNWQEMDKLIITLEIYKNDYDIIVGLYAPSVDSSIEIKKNSLENY